MPIYYPPGISSVFNAGVSSDGNTAGSTGTVSNRVVLVGTNGITLSQSTNAGGATVSISGAGGGGAAMSIGVSNVGNTAGNTTVNTGSRFVLAGAGAVTLSQATGANSTTVSISVPTQTAQTQNLHNVTLSGNTAGVMAQVSSGTLTLAGGNNVTLSQNANAVTISAANQTVQTQNVHNVTLSGNTAGVMAQISSGTLNLAGGNGITLSQNANSVTISGVSAQTTQTQNLHNVTLSGNTAGVMAQVSSGTLTLAGGNNITLSQAGNAVTISGSQSTAPSAVVASNSTYTSGTVVISGAGIVTVDAPAAGSVRISASQSVQTQNAIVASLTGNTAGVMAAITSGTLYLAGGPNITLSQNANSVSISAGAGGGGATFSGGVSNLGNTAGTTGTVSNQIVFVGGNNVTLSQSSAAGGATVTVSGASLSTAPSAIVASNSTYTSGTVVISGAGIVTVDNPAAGSVRISASQSVQTQNVHNLTISGNTAGAGAAVSSGTLTLAGGDNITLSQNGNAITISGAAGGGGGAGFSAGISGGNTSGDTGVVTGRVVLAGGNSITLSGSTNAGSMTISISGPAPGTLSNWMTPNVLPNSTIGSPGNQTLNMFPVEVDGYVSGSLAELFGSFSAGTTTSGTRTGTISMSLGIFSLNGHSLSLASSGSQSFTFSHTTNNTSSHNGLKGFTIPMNVNMSPGKWYFGVHIRTSGNSMSFSLVQNTGVTQQYFGRWDSQSQNSYVIEPGFGMYSTTFNSAMPSSFRASEVRGGAAAGINKIFLVGIHNSTIT